MDRYIVISADTHAGADLLDYRPYLESKYHDAFDRWAETFVSPYGDLVRPDADRNWDSARRMRELEADGVVAEVVYPNTIPPFYVRGALTATAPSAADFELRLAGLRAHNRWLAEWCGEFSRSARRHRTDPAQRRRRGGARRALGRRPRPPRWGTAPRSPARCTDRTPALARVRPGLACLRRAWRRGQRARRQQLARLRRPPGVALAVVDGDLMVLTPAAVDASYSPVSSTASPTCASSSPSRAAGGFATRST